MDDAPVAPLIFGRRWRLYVTWRSVLPICLGLSAQQHCFLSAHTISRFTSAIYPVSVPVAFGTLSSGEGRGGRWQAAVPVSRGRGAALYNTYYSSIHSSSCAHVKNRLPRGRLTPNARFAVCVRRGGVSGNPTSALKPRLPTASHPATPPYLHARMKDCRIVASWIHMPLPGGAIRLEQEDHWHPAKPCAVHGAAAHSLPRPGMGHYTCHGEYCLPTSLSGDVDGRR